MFEANNYYILLVLTSQNVLILFLRIHSDFVPEIQCVNERLL